MISGSIANPAALSGRLWNRSVRIILWQVMMSCRYTLNSTLQASVTPLLPSTNRNEWLV